MDDEQFKQLLNFLNYSWIGYRKVRKGVKKRISRHLLKLGCPNMGAYLDLLQRQRAVRKECEKRMTVPISRFFRDRELWIDLEQEIFPTLIAVQKEHLKVWSAGCARGEEVYSFMILWDRLNAKFKNLPTLEVIATDLNAEYIDKARNGVYAKSSLREVAPEIRDAYFEQEKSGNKFAIKPFLKKGINWQARSIICGPPSSGIHVIFLRNNLLTYYQQRFIKDLFYQITDSLAHGGWLIIGSHEKLPGDPARLMRHRACPWAYRKESAKGVSIRSR